MMSVMCDECDNVMSVMCDGVTSASCSLGTRFSDGDGSSNEVQRTMLELINQLDGFDPRGNIKVLMATNRLGDIEEGGFR